MIFDRIGRALETRRRERLEHDRRAEWRRRLREDEPPSPDDRARELFLECLDLPVLALLTHERDHGHSLCRRLEGMAPFLTGFDDDALYPVLRGLETGGYLHATLVPSPEGPAREHYAITLKGHARLRQARAGLDEFTDALARLRTTGRGRPDGADDPAPRDPSRHENEESDDEEEEEDEPR